MTILIHYIGLFLPLALFDDDIMFYLVA